MKQPSVYILASKRNGTYVGVTSNLVQRVWQHRNDLADGFTKRYCVHMLVWYELHGTMQSAIAREKAVKEWKRAWKIELIEKTSPQWLEFVWRPALTRRGHKVGAVREDWIPAFAGMTKLQPVKPPPSLDSILAADENPL